MRVGSKITEHRDLVAKGKHYRLNIVIKKAPEGGTFKGKTIWNILDRVILFRPDIETHSVSEVLSGTRYVISFGKIIK